MAPVGAGSSCWKKVVVMPHFRKMLTMWFQSYRFPRIAIVLICGCALIALYQFQLDEHCSRRTQKISLPERFVNKYKPLRSLIPKGEVACFMVDKDHINTKLMEYDGRLYLARYATSPRCLVDGEPSHWIVVDSDCPEIVPEIATSARWTLIADLRNGVRLYQTDRRE